MKGDLKFKVKYTAMFIGLLLISPFLWIADMLYSIVTCICHFFQELWYDTKENSESMVHAWTTSIKIIRHIPKMKLEKKNNENTPD